MKFEELGLGYDILDALYYMGFEKATEIQERAIPAILDGKDMIAVAQTGTGKTAAFMLPVLELASQVASGATSTLVVVPTRELAVQIDQQIQAFSYFVNVNSIAIYGGGGSDDWTVQKRALTKGADIVVATPGKLISHLNMGYVKFDKVQHLILDEADRMLDMGFVDDIKKIISYLPEKRQNLMFSATMPHKIKSLIKEILHNPVEITIALSKPAEGVLQAAYLVHEDQKKQLVNSLIFDKPQYKSILIFSSTKKKVNEIIRALKNKKYEVEGISSDFDQKEREAVLARFRAKRTRVLVATDVLSRGIDIKDINLVVNFDVPGNAEDYVHRIGRTARADTTGVALTLINENDMYNFDAIEKLIGKEVMKAPLPDGMGKGPEWNPTKRRSYGGRGPKGGGRSKHKGKRR